MTLFARNLIAEDLIGILTKIAEPKRDLQDAVTRVIEREGWADAPPLPENPPPPPREPQPYHPVTRPPTFRQGGYNR